MLFTLHEKSPICSCPQAAFPCKGQKVPQRIKQWHFLELLIHHEKYLEFLISSTCLGVNAKIHGLSWSFSLFCGTEEGKRNRPCIKPTISTAPHIAGHKVIFVCSELFISKSCFLPYSCARTQIIVLFVKLPLIRALLTYCWPVLHTGGTQ